MTDNENLSIHIKSVHELIENGYSKRTITRWQRQEKIIKLAPGQYIKKSVWDELFPVQKHLARVIAYSRTLHNPVFTHYSAAVALSCALLSAPHNVQVRGCGGAKRAGVVYRQDDSSVISSTITLRYGRDSLTVVDPITALIGCARDAPIREGLVIVESAFQRLGARLSYSRLHKALSEVKRVRGARKARYIADIMSPLSESPAETLARLAFLDLGFNPVQQYEIPTLRGVYRVDAALLKERLVLEIDGALKYQSGQDVLDEKVREDAIRLEGWDFVRFTWEDVLHPARVERKLRRKGII